MVLLAGKIDRVERFLAMLQLLAMRVKKSVEFSAGMVIFWACKQAKLQGAREDYLLWV